MKLITFLSPEEFMSSEFQNPSDVKHRNSPPTQSQVRRAGKPKAEAG